MTLSPKYKGQAPAWCPGCGNFAILNVLRRTFEALGLEPHEISIVSGIGQAAKLPHYTRCHTFNGLLGRTLPVATGLALANPLTRIIAIAGDGDCYGEGGNHLLHAIRRNPNITLLVHDNQVCGLARGEASPTSVPALQSRIQPWGNPSPPLNPLALAIAMDCGFVARAFAGASGLPHLQHLITMALDHRGFALIDILQNCVTFNKINTFHWYKEHTYFLEEGYDPGDRVAAFARSLEWEEGIPLGLLYRRQRPTIDEGLPRNDRQSLAASPFLSQAAVAGELQLFY